MNAEILGIASLGFLLGMRHAADPDHIAAVTTLVTRHRDPRSAAMIGLAWGAGHTVTIFGVGSAIILLGLAIPARVSASLELLVAAMLVGLGLANLVGQKPAAQTGRARGFLRPAAIGVAHGLAGSAAVALLVLATLQSRAWSVVYLLIYGLGTVLGMLLITVLIAVPMQLAGNRVRGMHRVLHTGAGLVSIGVGLLLAYRVTA